MKTHEPMLRGPAGIIRRRAAYPSQLQETIVLEREETRAL
jgi:hypothetical protein